MKLTEKLSEKDLKNISKVKIVEENSHRNGVVDITTEVLTITKDKILSHVIVSYRVDNVRNNRYAAKGEYKNVLAGLRQINRAIKLQDNPTRAYTCKVTCELKRK